MSALVGAAIKPDSIPRQAFRKACAEDDVALSQAVWDEIASVLHRPKLARFVDQNLRDELLDLLLSAAVWFDPAEHSAANSDGMRHATAYAAVSGPLDLR